MITKLPPVKNGDTWSFSFVWSNNNTPIDLTGCTAKMQVQTGPGPSGSIYGINGNGNYDNYDTWYINGNSTGANWIDFMKIKEGQRTETNSFGDQWAIRGPVGSNQFGTW